MLMRLEPFELLDEGGAFQIQQLRRLPFVALRTLERAANERELDGFNVAPEVEAIVRKPDFRGLGRSCLVLNVAGQILYIDLRSTLAECECPLDGILQLPDVARPVIRHQSAKCVLGNR